jgi:hypothetical protein
MYVLSLLLCSSGSSGGDSDGGIGSSNDTKKNKDKETVRYD